MKSDFALGAGGWSVRQEQASFVFTHLLEAIDFFLLGFERQRFVVPTFTA